MDPQCHHRREPLIAAEPAPVPPLSAYVAKRCPLRVQLDLVEPAVPLEPTADVQMRLDEGVAFEVSVVAELRAVAGSDWVFVDEAASPGLQVEATTSAIAVRVAVVVGARLPNDAAAARSGAPDVLVWARGGYVAVDVKHHRTIDAGDSGLLTSTLAVPTPTAAALVAGSELRASKDDALQLAHYRCMLQAQGRAAPTSLGGIIGKERLVV